MPSGFWVIMARSEQLSNAYQPEFLYDYKALQHIFHGAAQPNSIVTWGSLCYTGFIDGFERGSIQRLYRGLQLRLREFQGYRGLMTYISRPRA